MNMKTAMLYRMVLGRYVKPACMWSVYSTFDLFFSKLEGFYVIIA